MMEKLKMHSPNLTQQNIAKIRELFPGCVTEAIEKGRLKLAVDFDQLRQELSESLVEGPQERYHLNWPGKQVALLTANSPIAKTLRPCREESVDFDTTRNLFIEGDNLDALKLLQETYLGKIKMIYIDPPYNTGNDFIYEDDFCENTVEFLKRSNQKDEQGNRLVANTQANGRFHSDWLSMMYPRLKLARSLLKDDGLIFISIDDGEVFNLRKICDELLGEQNFISTFMWKRKKEISSDSKNVAIQGEYILAYGKTSDTVVNFEPLSKEYVDKSYNEPTEQFPEGRWRPVPITVSKGLSGGGYTYSVTTPSGTVHERLWAYPENSFKELVKKKRVYWGKNYDGIPQRVIYAHESKGQPTSNYWSDVASNKEGKKEILDLFVDNLFDTPKPTQLIRKMIELSCGNQDIILDFFPGSSTTAHAVMQLNAEDGGNRKFIMMQLPEPCDEMSEALKAGYKSIAEISKERIRRAGRKIIESQCYDGWDKDVGFRVLKVDTSNMADVYYTPDAVQQGQLKFFTDNIMPDRTPEDLLFQVLLGWGVDLSLPIRQQSIQDKTVFFVNEPPYDLIACFDVNISEELVKELARFEPLRVVFRDNGFVSDAVKINVEQIFKQMSPGTEVKSI